MRADLIDKIRGTDDMFSMNRSLDVVIANIRKKLGKRFIETVPATGYRL
jgi:DNA-binding response OmpR family regulator